MVCCLLSLSNACIFHINACILNSMKSIQIRDTPTNIYQAVKAAAKQSGRSLSQQALIFIAQGSKVDLNPNERRLKAVEEFKLITLRDNPFDATASVREDRDR